MRRPSIWIATLALFVALGGSAAAAKHYLITSTSQIKPGVLSKLKGSTGAQGAQGPPGPVGAAGAQGPQGPEGVGSGVGDWEPVTLSGKVQDVATFQEASARTENGGAIARLRGVLEVTSEINAGETVFTIPQCCRPKYNIEIGMNVSHESGSNRVGSIRISPTGAVTDPETPVPIKVWYLLDDLTWNLN